MEGLLSTGPTPPSLQGAMKKIIYIAIFVYKMHLQIEYLVEALNEDEVKIVIF